MKANITGLLFRLGLAMGFIPILVASFLVRRNLFIESIDRMDEFWKKYPSIAQMMIDTGAYQGSPSEKNQDEIMENP